MKAQIFCRHTERAEVVEAYRDKLTDQNVEEINELVDHDIDFLLILETGQPTRVIALGGK